MDSALIIGILLCEGFKANATKEFFCQLNALPDGVQKSAKRAFAMWQEDPYNLTLKFREKDGIAGVWSASIGGYRAVAERQPDDSFLWTWIGDHGAYDDYLKRLRRARR